MYTPQKFPQDKIYRVNHQEKKPYKKLNSEKLNTEKEILTRKEHF